MTPDKQFARITGFFLEEQTQLSLADVCRACAAQADRIVELVNEGPVTVLLDPREAVLR